MKHLPVLASILVLAAVVGFAFAAPIGHSVTLDTVTIAVTANGQTNTSTLHVPDLYGTGTVTIPVSCSTLSQIQNAFGYTTFSFPGSYTGHFTVNGQSVTVVISSGNTFTVKYTC